LHFSSNKALRVLLPSTKGTSLLLIRILDRSVHRGLICRDFVFASEPEEKLAALAVAEANRSSAAEFEEGEEEPHHLAPGAALEE
jgi:hypothetical protein